MLQKAFSDLLLGLVGLWEETLGLSHDCVCNGDPETS